MERERLRFTLCGFFESVEVSISKIKANAFYCRMSAALTDRYGKDKRFLEIMQFIIGKSRNEKKIRRFLGIFYTFAKRPGVRRMAGGHATVASGKAGCLAECGIEKG